MRVLLDESLPRRLKHELSGHQVQTVAEIGWSGSKNGDLLRMADERFDVFMTMDDNLPEQQNLSDFRLAVVIREARSNDVETLRPRIA